MQFNSIEFLIFFPAVAVVYYLLPHARRWIWLLASSIFFFCYLYYISYTPENAFRYACITAALLSVILLDYFIAIQIEKSKSTGRGNPRVYLIIGVSFSLALLFLFKYLNFFNQTIAQIAGILHLHYPLNILKILVPLGISYYTFHSLSYLIEVYRGVQKPERHLGIFSLYILFFPKMVAGPIERPQNLLSQFREEHHFDYCRVMDGLKLMAWGLFKKIVIADRAAIIANEVYNRPQDYWGVYLIIATLCFIFQVYCDFSGYSDIAIGGAQVFGITLSENFRRPYLSTSIPDLWRRWHISLISWFRDYVYIPLGGNRVSRFRWQFNIFLIFFLSGIWHGANWTFVIWASLNGFYSLCSIWTESLRKKIVLFLRLAKIPAIHRAMKILMTFLLFTFAGIFFRANTTTDALYIITHLFTGIGDLLKTLLAMNYELFKSYLVIQNKTTFLGFAKPAFLPEMITLALAIVAMEIIQLIQENSTRRMRDIISQKPWYVQWILYYCLVFAILFLGMSGQQFIYFKF